MHAQEFGQLHSLQPLICIICMQAYSFAASQARENRGMANDFCGGKGRGTERTGHCQAMLCARDCNSKCSSDRPQSCHTYHISTYMCCPKVSPCCKGRAPIFLPCSRSFVAVCMATLGNIAISCMHVSEHALPCSSLFIASGTSWLAGERVVCMYSTCRHCLPLRRQRGTFACPVCAAHGVCAVWTAAEPHLIRCSRAIVYGAAYHRACL